MNSDLLDLTNVRVNSGVLRDDRGNLHVFCELSGMSEDDAHHFREWLQHMVAVCLSDCSGRPTLQ
jgi:hypothetical protein